MLLEVCRSTSDLFCCAFREEVSASRQSDGLSANPAFSVRLLCSPAEGNNRTTTNFLRLLKMYFLRTCEGSLMDLLCKCGM